MLKAPGGATPRVEALPRLSLSSRSVGHQVDPALGEVIGSEGRSSC
jgi:hypothetical protein